MNILFIGGQGRTPDANGVCICNMAKELLARGHSVWILAMGDVYVKGAGSLDGATIWEEPMDLYTRFTKYKERHQSIGIVFAHRVLGLIRHFILLFFYPNTSPIRAHKVARKALSIVRSCCIQTVVSIYCPYDNILAGKYIKKRMGGRVKVVSYHLDLRTGSTSMSGWVRKYIRKHARSSLRKEVDIMDRVLIPFSGRKEIEGLARIDYNKVVFVGFPVFLEGTSCSPCPLPFDTHVVNISYVGTLYPGNRDPRYILSLFESISDRINLKVHFWGDANIFESVIDASPIASYHGVVDNNYVRFILDHSDFLLNIGNKLAYDMLPSKVFGLFATRKPIINVVTHPEDATTPFFIKYNHSINLEEYENNSNDANALLEFLVSQKGVLANYAEDVFHDFKPGTICDLILI